MPSETLGGYPGVETQLISALQFISPLAGEAKLLSVGFHAELSRFFHREVSHL